MPSNWDKINTASDVVRLLELVCNSIRIVFAPAMQEGTLPHPTQAPIWVAQHHQTNAQEGPNLGSVIPSHMHYIELPHASEGKMVL